MVMAMIEGDAWLDQGANLLVFGPPGVGKTHLIASVGHALIERGKRVYFTRTTDLVQRLQAARRDLRLPAEIAKLDRFDPLLLDDFSYVRRDSTETTVLFELIAEHCSHSEPAVLRMEPGISRTGDDRGRHRPPGASRDDPRAQRGKLSAKER